MKLVGKGVFDGCETEWQFSFDGIKLELEHKVNNGPHGPFTGMVDDGAQLVRLFIPEVELIQPGVYEAKCPRGWLHPYQLIYQ